jgi:hypothetical protein
MPTIDDVSIINSNTVEARTVDTGLERTICDAALCGSKTLDVFRRTVSDGQTFSAGGGDDYHLVYVMEAPSNGVISFNGATHAAVEGAGALLVPGETASFEASGSDLELLHMVTPQASKTDCRAGPDISSTAIPYAPSPMPAAAVSGVFVPKARCACWTARG